MGGEDKAARKAAKKLKKVRPPPSIFRGHV